MTRHPDAKTTLYTRERSAEGIVRQGWSVGDAHQAGPREHEWQGVHAVIPAVDETDAIPLDARAGDLVVFSSLLVHQTVGNHTRDRDRRAWVIQYCRGDQRNEVTGEVYDNCAWVLRDGVPQPGLESERPYDLRHDRP